MVKPLMHPWGSRQEVINYGFIAPLFPRVRGCLANLSTKGAITSGSNKTLGNIDHPVEAGTYILWEDDFKCWEGN